MRNLACIAALACTLESGSGTTQQERELLLISLSGTDRVVLTDTASGSVAADFTVARGPHEIALSRDGRMAYIAGGGVTAIDLRARTARAFDLTPHTRPHDARVSPDGRRVWIAVAPSRAILEVDAASGQILRTLSLERDGAWFVTATPDGRMLFVPHLEGKAISSVDVASGRSRVIIEGGAFSGAAISPDGRELWAIEHDASRILVIATDTGEAIARIPVATALFGRLAFAPAGDRVYVVQGKSLAAFDARARRLVAAMEMPLEGKVLAISPSGTRAAISNPAASRVTLVDLSRMTVERSIEAGPAPDGVAWVRPG